MSKGKKPTAEEEWINGLVDSHLESAAEGAWNGKGLSPYYVNCKRVNPLRGVATIVTRDVGLHSDGLWKNPDCERNLHLSVSFFHPSTLRPVEHDGRISSMIARRLFFPNMKLVWVQQAVTELGRTKSVLHYHMWCDKNWRPIQPELTVDPEEFVKAGLIQFVSE